MTIVKFKCPENQNPDIPMSDSVRPMSDILSSVNDNLEKSFALDCYSATSQSESYHYTVYHFQTDDYIQKSPKSVRH